jgi:hypothetical protein
VKPGRKDFSNALAPERKPDEGLDDCTAKGLKADPHFSTRKIAKALSIRSTPGRNHLTLSFGMKCCHMRWVPRPLTVVQKAKRAGMAGSILETLESHAASSFHFLWTDGESWMVYEDHHETV